MKITGNDISGLTRALVRVNGMRIISVEDGYHHTSLPTEITGNTDGDITLITASENEIIIIKGILIIGNGNQGTAKVIGADDQTLLPCYFSLFNRAATSQNLRIQLDSGKHVKLRASGRGSSDETFVGITYYKIGTD